MFAPYHTIAFGRPFCLIWLLLVTLLALELLRCEFADQAPKGEAMARVTFATAFGHPLGPQQRLASGFVPYHRIWSPILFDLAFVSDFASFGAAEGRIL